MAGAMMRTQLMKMNKLHDTHSSWLKTRTTAHAAL